MNALEEILLKRDQSELEIQTLGSFSISRLDKQIDNRSWTRDKALQLFQYLITSRHRQGQHKEQIIDRLWEDITGDDGDRDFKVAMHGINKVIEPERKKRQDPKYIIRQGLTYRIDFTKVWIDVESFDELVTYGNEVLSTDKKSAIKAYKAALKLYRGIYLPNRVYEDWASMERERLQVLALGSYITLGELLLDENTMESIRLSQQALLIDNTWEDAYRLQMKAYFKNGNRPNAVKAYQKCKTVLDKEYGLEPLPETKVLLEQIRTS